MHMKGRYLSMNRKYLVHFTPAGKHIGNWTTTPMHDVRHGTLCHHYPNYFDLLADTQRPEYSVEYLFTHAAWEKVCEMRKDAA